VSLTLSALLALIITGCGGSSPSSPTEQRIPNYAGSWSGNYVITGCTQSGGVSLANICGALGNTPPYSMSLTQSSRNVSGTFMLGSIAFPSTGGTVGADGSLQLNSTEVANGITIIASWNLNMPTTALSGTISQQWASSTLSGGATVTGTISTALHSAAALAPTSLRSILTPSDLARAIAGAQ
jgi:hypothetical protein